MSDSKRKHEFLREISKFETIQKHPTKVFYKKHVYKNFVKFTGKHLCQSLFFSKVAKKRV